MSASALLVLLAGLGSVARGQTITFRSLEAASTSDSSANESFVFDGTNSDIAQQLYVRHKAGGTGHRVTLTSIPSAVTDRLDPLNIRFDDLPGLVQRAVLWDSGFAISPGNDPVQIWTMENYTMADIAIPKDQVENVDCSFLNCSQPDGVTAFYTKYCTGWQILNASRCVAEVFKDEDASTFLGMMWSVGGDPDMTPELRFRDHSWTEYVKEFNASISFSVYAVHTVSAETDPAWNECPAGYASLTVPCHRRDQYSDEDMAANMTIPTGSAWVTTWLEEEFAQDSGFDKILLVPIILSAVIVLVGFSWLWQRRREKKRDVHEFDDDSSPDCSARSPYFILRPVRMSQLTSQGSTLSSYYESAGSNRTLKILLDSEHLQDKRIPYESIQFEGAISKGSSGEVWVCKYNQQLVAVKRLLQTKEQKAQNVQAFAEEIELNASLVHPHIIEFIGVAWNTLNNLVMVLELCPMGSLQRYLRANSDLLSWSKEKIGIAIGIAQALEYLHGRTPALIHRDLKANNILLTRELVPKLIDFGVSRDTIDLTMTAGIGTPYWTAPEILEGKHYTEQADMYSFGVVLSELDTGRAPYSDAVTENGGTPKPFHILQNVMAGTLRPSFSANCPAYIVRIGLACLELDPTRRPTARELVQELENGK